MKAISLTRPWPWAILHAGKRVENRSRKDGRMPDICRHRGPLLLHAAQSWDDDCGDFIRERFPWDGADGVHVVDNPRYVAVDEMRSEGKRVLVNRRRDREHPAGGIVGRCVAVGHIGPDPDRDPVIPIADPSDDLDNTLYERLDLRWWMGGYALVLDQVEPTPFVECKGALGLWTPPPHVVHVLSKWEGRCCARWVGTGGAAYCKLPRGHEGEHDGIGGVAHGFEVRWSA